MSQRTTLEQVQATSDRGDHEAVLRLTEAMLAERPGDDAAHEYRARAFLALERFEEAERHAAEAVRLDPDEIRYRELLAQALAAAGAHREAAVEYRRLARNDPRQPAWTLAEAEERLDAAQAREAVEAARRAVRLDPRNAAAHLALAQGLTRTGDAREALRAAAAAAELLPNDPAAREALADARWLAEQEAAAFAEFRALAMELSGADRARVVAKARAIYRGRVGALGRLVAGVGPLFDVAMRNGWVRLR